MFHLIPFLVGVITGVTATLLVKNDKTKASLQRAQTRLRKARESFAEELDEEPEEEFVAEAPRPEKKSASRRRTSKPAERQDTVAGDD